MPNEHELCSPARAQELAQLADGPCACGCLPQVALVRASEMVRRRLFHLQKVMEHSNDNLLQENKKLIEGSSRAAESAVMDEAALQPTTQAAAPLVGFSLIPPPPPHVSSPEAYRPSATRAPTPTLVPTSTLAPTPTASPTPSLSRPLSSPRPLCGLQVLDLESPIQKVINLLRQMQTDANLLEWQVDSLRRTPTRARARSQASPSPRTPWSLALHPSSPASLAWSRHPACRHPSSPPGSSASPIPYLPRLPSRALSTSSPGRSCMIFSCRPQSTFRTSITASVGQPRSTKWWKILSA